MASMGGGKSVGIEFTVSGLAEAIEALQAMPESVYQTAAKYMKTLADQAEKVVRDETPRDSGKLANSTTQYQRTKYKYDIGQTATAGGGSGGGRRNRDYFYGRGVRQGTRGGYYIRPRARKAIFWDAKKGCQGLTRPIPWVGKPFTAQHPGIEQPYNYVAESVNRLQPAINNVSRAICAEVSHETYKRFRTRSTG